MHGLMDVPAILASIAGGANLVALSGKDFGKRGNTGQTRPGIGDEDGQGMAGIHRFRFMQGGVCGIKRAPDSAMGGRRHRSHAWGPDWSGLRMERINTHTHL